MEVNLLEDREDGYKAFYIIFTGDEYAELEKLRRYREMETIEQTIEGALNVEIEAMY